MAIFNYRFVRSVVVAASLIAGCVSAYPNITQELGPRLSSNAAIIFPGSAEFLLATDRDNEQDPPTYKVVVEVDSEADVQETVTLGFQTHEICSSPHARSNMPPVTTYHSLQPRVCTAVLRH